jgi:hypothetical protein
VSWTGLTTHTADPLTPHHLPVETERDDANNVNRLRRVRGVDHVGTCADIGRALESERVGLSALWCSEVKVGDAHLQCVGDVLDPARRQAFSVRGQIDRPSPFAFQPDVEPFPRRGLTRKQCFSR